MIPLLVAAFILSGAAGLIYESIWTRYLGLFVGHSAYAQIIVLVIFLGGMSLGAQLTSSRSRRIKSPLFWYAVIELVVGILALAFHDVYTATTSFAYATVFPATGGVMLTIAKWTLAGLLILPQSILLGATFPLMSAGVIRLSQDPRGPGRVLSLLYFANSIGAAAGVLVAGFGLLKAVGLPGTLMVAGFVNVVVAVVVGLLARTLERADAEAGVTDTAPAESADRGPHWRALLLVSFGTAVASFIYEIAWIRMLSLVLGSATHSFELMLSAFILGLALGALWIRRRIDTIADPIRFLGLVQWSMGLMAVATLPLYVVSFNWVGALLGTVQANDNGYLVFIIARYVIAALIMLPATFCAGMTLPIITKVLMRGGAGERAIGTVYSVNTLGSIVGVIIAGLVLMPLIGLKLLLITGAVVDIALGVWLVSRVREADAGADAPIARAVRMSALPGTAVAVALAMSVGILTLVGVTAKFDLPRLTSGVYRHGVVATDVDYTVPFYKDGRTASVSLRRSAEGFLTLATNGKPDASMDQAWLGDTLGTEELFQLTRDLATQLLLPLVTMAHAPRAENAAVIGFGSGMSSHVLLGSPHAKDVVTIEIEPEIMNAAKGFMPANKRAYDDPRSTIVVDDAKSYFASSGRKFDLILSEPSNPWVSGVSGLFTREFYQRVSTQLTEGGVFGQWLHLYELNDALATSVMFAIDEVFKDYAIFYTSNADILIVAANDTLPAPSWDITAFPGIDKELKRAIPLTPEQFEALRLGDRATLSPIIQIRGAANSDYFPALDLGSERARFLRENAEGYTGLSEGRFDVVAALSGRKADFGRSGVSPTPEIPRSHALALGATLRAIRTLGPRVGSVIHRNAETRAATYRLDQLMRMAETRTPPADWHRWVEHVIASDAELHGGTAGVVDSAFFVTLRRFAANAGAPAEARASVDFMHGIGSWNWPEVVAAAGVLQTSTDSIGWVPDPLLRNGLVIAHIKLRNYTAAREALRVFAQRTSEDEFRERIISSYLIYADSTLKSKLKP
jgi:predicted membrane-bound spermidine synthase